MVQILRLRSSRQAVLAACVCASVLLTGCPFLTPKLAVSPIALSFGSTGTRESFAIANDGASALSWTVAEVVWNGQAQAWVAQDVPWLAIDPAKVSGNTLHETDRVFLTASRTGLAAGDYLGAGVQVTSNGGTAIIPVSLTVPETTEPGQPGQGDIKVAPNAVTIHGLTDTATFDATNEGDALVHWYLEVTINAPNVPAGTPIQVAATPSDAVTSPGKKTTVTLGVSDVANFNQSFLNYTIAIRNKTDDALLAQVAVTVDLVGPALPDADPTLLDFGKDGYQLSFAVANVGDPHSLMDFAVFRKEDTPDDTYVPYDVEADPLIAAITLPKGGDDVLGDADNPWLNAREVSVTISRDGIEQDLEFRDLYIGVVKGTDASGNPIMDLDIVPKKVQVRVEAAAFVEGAINRSRPPSLMRFVFMLRDKRGIAIDASNERIRDQIRFFTKEDGFPLDPDESSQFVTGPEHLKCNIVLLLDFTGSMYQAGTQDPQNPLQAGEAIRQMVQAAKGFVLDLPDSYRVALMEYHDRGQPSRTIHGFDTNKQALLTALDRFSVPVSEHGASAIYDALYDACGALVQEDSAQALPFDEADVRSVVFVSDGWDTSSNKKINELTKFAQDSRVRLYPIGYSGRLSNPVNGATLIELAAETGGHTYYAPEITDLTRLLDTENAVAFRDVLVDLGLRTATVRMSNNGAEAFSWRATENLDWLTVTPPSGMIPPLHRTPTGAINETGVRDLSVFLSPAMAPGTYEGLISIASNAGDATLAVSATVATDGALAAFSVTPATDDAGRVWRELRSQVVLSYTSLFQSGTHTYSIEVNFPDSGGELTSAAFEEDAVFFGGDVRAGQISLSTTGIHDGTAEVFLRTDYVPRGISQFRVRFIIDVPVALTPNLSILERIVLRNKLRAALNSAVSLAPQGLLTDWRLLNNEGFGIFTIVTEPSQPLMYADFGNLLRLTFDDLGPDDAFTVGFRIDNDLYYSPASATSPSLTKYFLYPGGLLNPEGVLSVAAGSNTASPALNVGDFALPIDPEAPNVWDRDGDGWPDFDDSAPDNLNVGDQDHDGVPDLDDADPLNPSIH